MSEWIDVKERLPIIGDGNNFSEVVFGWLEGGGMGLFRRHLRRECGWVYCFDWKWGSPILTHWMPLPDPPTKGAPK